MTLITQICTNCNEPKPLDTFHKHKDCKYGYNTVCKNCVTKESKIRWQNEKRNKIDLLYPNGTKLCPGCNLDRELSNYVETPDGNIYALLCIDCEKTKKVCSKCKNIKQHSKFAINKITRQGLQSYCAKCKLESGMENPERKRIIRNKYRNSVAEKNKDKIFSGYEKKICSTCKKNKSINDFCRDNKKVDAFSVNCKSCVKIYNAQYYKTNIRNNKAILLRSNSWRINHRKTHPGFAMIERTRRRISTYIKKGGKSASTMELLGCTSGEFKDFFELMFRDEMTWDDFMKGDIHIDHIIPLSIFDMTIPLHQKVAFHHKNTQPLWATDNLIKRNSIPPMFSLGNYIKDFSKLHDIQGQ